jgi:hypothetical protein
MALSGVPVGHDVCNLERQERRIYIERGQSATDMGDWLGRSVLVYELCRCLGPALVGLCG